MFKSTWPTQLDISLNEAKGVLHTLEADTIVKKVAVDPCRSKQDLRETATTVESMAIS